MCFSSLHPTPDVLGFAWPLHSYHCGPFASPQSPVWKPQWRALCSPLPWSILPPSLRKNAVTGAPAQMEKRGLNISPSFFSCVFSPFHFNLCSAVRYSGEKSIDLNGTNYSLCHSLDVWVHFMCASVLLCASKHVCKHPSSSKYCTCIFIMHYNVWHWKRWHVGVIRNANVICKQFI